MAANTISGSQAARAEASGVLGVARGHIAGNARIDCSVAAKDEIERTVRCFRAQILKKKTHALPVQRPYAVKTADAIEALHDECFWQFA
jgi:hypothetical protein